jgi:hypothetical protein
MITKAVTLILAATCATASASTIDYQSQDRSVSIGALLPFGPQSQTDNAPNNFNSYIVDLTGTFSDVEGSASAHASQFSLFTTTSIIANGSAGGTAGPPAGSSSGWGNSYLSVSFLLDESTDYTLDFDAFGDDGTYSFTGASLNHSGSVLGADISESGTLDAGLYTFVIDFGVTSALGNGDYSFNFTVPAPGSASLMGLGLLAASRRRR